MTLNQFISKYNGKQVEYHSYDPRAKYQCVDLVNQYIVEVLGSTPIIGTDAKDFHKKYNKNEFDWIPNTPEAIIKAGDIPTWDGDVGGGAGHIAIAIKDGTLEIFESLDQNWSKPLFVTKEIHNYHNIQGWLHPKGTMSDLHTYLGVTTDAEAKTKLKEHLGEANSKCNWGLTGDQGGYLGSERKKNNELTAENASHILEIEALNARKTQLEQELADCEAEAPEIDPAKWLENGLMVEVTEGNKKTTTNYKPA